MTNTTPDTVRFAHTSIPKFVSDTLDHQHACPEGTEIVPYVMKSGLLSYVTYNSLPVGPGICAKPSCLSFLFCKKKCFSLVLGISPHASLLPEAQLSGRHTACRGSQKDTASTAGPFPPRTAACLLWRREASGLEGTELLSL